MTALEELEMMADLCRECADRYKGSDGLSRGRFYQWKDRAAVFDLAASIVRDREVK